MILGYTLTTFPKSRKTLMHNQSNRDLWHNCKRNTKQTKQTKKQLHLNVGRRTLHIQVKEKVNITRNKRDQTIIKCVLQSRPGDITVQEVSR